MVLDLVIIGLAIALQPVRIVAFILISPLLGFLLASLVVVIGIVAVATGARRRIRTPPRRPPPWWSRPYSASG